MLTKIKSWFKKKEETPKLTKIGMVCQIRLTSADEVIGFVVGMTDDKRYIVQEPMMVNENFGETGPSVLLSKYVWFGKNALVVFDQSHVISMVPVTKDIQDYYFNSVVHSNNVVSSFLNEEIKQSTEDLKELNADSEFDFETDISNHPGNSTLH